MSSRNAPAPATPFLTLDRADPRFLVYASYPKLLKTLRELDGTSTMGTVNGGAEDGAPAVQLEFRGRKCALLATPRRVGLFTAGVVPDVIEFSDELLALWSASAVHDAAGFSEQSPERPEDPVEIGPPIAMLEWHLIVYARTVLPSAWDLAGPAFAPGWSLKRWRNHLARFGSPREADMSDRLHEFLGKDWPKIWSAINDDITAILVASGGPLPIMDRGRSVQQHASVFYGITRPVRHRSDAGQARHLIVDFRARALDDALEEALVVSAYPTLLDALADLDVRLMCTPEAELCGASIAFRNKRVEIDPRPVLFRAAEDAEPLCCNPRAAVVEQLLTVYARTASPNSCEVADRVLAPESSLTQLQRRLAKDGSEHEAKASDDLHALLRDVWPQLAGAIETDLATIVATP